jgi:hypothetical protein
VRVRVALDDAERRVADLLFIRPRQGVRQPERQTPEPQDGADDDNQAEHTRRRDAEACSPHARGCARDAYRDDPSGIT